MEKKILLSLGAVLAVAAGVVGMSAFEAHVINVTAHIENALSVMQKEIKFGTVFPQEYLEKTAEIKLSESFLGAARVDDVEYKIVCKPKPCPVENSEPLDPTCVADTTEVTPHNPTGWHYLDLCQFLSQMPEDELGDIGKPSYYHPAVGGTPANCEPFVYAGGNNFVTDPQGMLSKLAQDFSDIWTIDLKVPPVKGYVGQDWPGDCPTVEANDKTYGADLWIEVTGISESGNNGPDPKELACIASGGTVETSMCCLGTSDFPNTCTTGACGCGPGNIHEVKTCSCPAETCFDGSSCVQIQTGCLTDADCDDQNPATTDSCDTGTGECVHAMPTFLTSTFSIPSLRDYYDGTENYSEEFGANLWRGQTFTASGNYTLKSFKVKLWRDGWPGVITGAIRATAGSLPVGPDLCTATTNGDDLYLGWPSQWREFDCEPDVALSAGTEYAIILHSPGTWAYYRGSTEKGYAGGIQITSTDAGVNWSAYNSSPMEAIFEVWD